MRNLAKILILDKNILWGTSTDRLCSFAENHFLVLSDVLLYENLTTKNQQEQLLDRFSKMIISGGRLGPSLSTVIYAEGEELRPYGELVDLDSITNEEYGYRCDAVSYNWAVVRERFEREKGAIEGWRDSMDSFHGKIEKESPDMLASMRKMDNCEEMLAERFRVFTDCIDREDIHRAAVVEFQEMTSCPERFCLSSEWMSWHCIRLRHILCQEFTLQKHNGAELSTGKIENWCQDMLYVLFLSRADGLITKDKGCRYLAEAAFPGKDVFSSLDEVGDDYLVE